MVLELLLVMSVGFLGSFGHCVGMCGPLALTFSLQPQSPQNLLLFHAQLNFGRLLSYVIVGVGLGFLGEGLSAIGSDFRRFVSFALGILLVWSGVVRIAPQLLPRLPLWQQPLHDRLQQWMRILVHYPLGIGLVWGLVPCGFLYTAQLKAADADNWILSALTMAGFGLGTLPAMVGLGLWADRVSPSRRYRLQQWGAWVTVMIGVLTLLRDDGMVDYSGYAAIGCWVLTLVARPLAKVFPQALVYRRGLGVGGFFLTIVHLFHSIEHAFQWQLQGFWYLLPQHRQGLIAGMVALLCMVPLVITSTDAMVEYLGLWWRRLHLLAIPGLGCGVLHVVLSGSHFLGGIGNPFVAGVRSIGIAGLFITVLLCRSRWCWRCLGLEKWYVSAGSTHNSGG